tara:strand:+ start:106 stop:684 length:579 start_codon:yes stop_codon:yes gene_type:complete
MADLESVAKVVQDWTVLLVFAGTISAGVHQAYQRVVKPVGVILNTVMTMGQQLKPNGGKTMFDKIGRIEGHVIRNATVAKVLLQESADAVFETDENGDCVWVNETYTSMTGLSTDQASGRGWWAAVAMKDRETVTRDWEEAIERRVPFTGHYRWTNGVDEFMVRCRVKLALSPDGKFYGAIGVVKRVENYAS